MRSVQRRLQSNPIRLISPTKLIFKPNNYGHYFEQISHQLKDIWRLNTVILCKKSNSIYFGFPKKCLSFIFQFSQADKSFISFLVSMSQICVCSWKCNAHHPNYFIEQVKISFFLKPQNTYARQYWKAHDSSPWQNNFINEIQIYNQSPWINLMANYLLKTQFSLAILKSSILIVNI